MKKFYILIVMLLLPICSFAQTDCGPYKVSMIQAQASDLLVLLKSQSGREEWKQIGLWSAPSTKPYLAILMQAFAIKKSVTLRYWIDNYSCDETDYVNIPTMLRMS